MSEQPEQTIPAGTSAESIHAEVVNISQGGAGEIIADNVTLSSSGAARVSATQASMDNSMVLAAQVGSLNASESVLLAVQAREVMISGVVGAAAADTISMNDSRAGVVVGKQVSGSRLQTVVLLAGKVDAPVETTVDARGLLLFGATVGLVSGVVVGLMRILFGRKR